MDAQTINQVIAVNLDELMKAKGITQSALAEKSKVAQTTISLYLRPEARLRGASGKEPSAKLTELDKLASALEVGVRELLLPTDPRERAFYKRIESAYRDLIDSDPDGFTGNTESGGLDELPPVPARSIATIKTRPSKPAPQKSVDNPQRKRSPPNVKKES